MFEAKIIDDSLGIFNDRLTTIQCTFPRFILAEMNTHKMLVKNSASARAIPFAKMVKSVRESPFVPLRWMKDHHGMQGSDYIDDPEAAAFRTAQWLEAMKEAADNAEKLNADQSVFGEYGKGISKQICNRPIEAFAWHTALISGTEWENFFALRAHPAAEIHMQKIAELMLEAMNNSIPSKLTKDQSWHLPYITTQEHIECTLEDTLTLSTVRCARTSYTLPGSELSTWSMEKYKDNHAGLIKNGHWSPMEHPGRTMNETEYFAYFRAFVLGDEQLEVYKSENTNTDIYKIDMFAAFNIVTEYGWCGNYRGFIPYRKMFPYENKKDSRLIKHHYNQNQ